MPRQPDYGLPDIKTRGKPRYKGTVSEPGMVCPLCGCETIARIEIDVEDERLKGGRGLGTYLSCPACPWASPMACVAAGKAPQAET